jgi:hypothetical protein
MPDTTATNWTRLRARRDTIDPGIGLAARIADPLWLLCRQLQMAEFLGDDGGTITSITVRSTWVPFTHWSAGVVGDDGTVSWQPYERDRPLEALVEDDRMTIGGEAPPLLATVEAGQRLERRLRGAGLGALATNSSLTTVIAPAAATSLALHVHRDHTVDGFMVRAQLDAARTALASGLSTADATQLTTVLDEWATWFDGRFGHPTHGSSWVQERLEHRFCLAAPHPDGGALVLRAPEYLGNGIVWSELEWAEGVTPPADLPTDRAEQHEVTRTYPQSLRWPGMPVDRFWEMEDATVDLGTLTLDPADLPGMLALDMAATASTDWFLTELPLPTAGMARIDSIEVVDSFGTRTTLTADALPDDIGRLFTPSTRAARDRAGDGWLVMAPRLGARVDGPAREEILLVRDELANLGWLVERVGPGDDGEPGELRSTAPAVPPASPKGELTYRLTTGVPDHWHPLVPGRRANGQLELARGRMFDEPELTLPITTLARQVDTLLDEEVPREGTRIQRGWQYARWFDGSRHLWSGRSVDPGRGEGNSALHFDDTY